MTGRADPARTPAALAAEIRSVPRRARAVTRSMTEDQLRRPGGERALSAIEVVGQLVDELETWHGQVRVARSDDEPDLAPGVGHGALADANYRSAPLFEVHARLTRACEEFARTVESLTAEELERTARHRERGRITVRDCVTLPLDSVHDHLQAARDLASAAPVESA